MTAVVILMSACLLAVASTAAANGFAGMMLIYSPSLKKRIKVAGF
jgi:hypothetical protein